MDPYYAFGTPNFPGINAVRPLYESHVPVVKPYQVRRIKPDAIILGSSRAEVGLDPQHPGWAAKNVFNYGLPSATSYEVMLAFLDAQSGGQLKQAVVGLDFFGFNSFFPRNREYLEARFSDEGVRAFADFLTAELSQRQPGGSNGPSSGPTHLPPHGKAQKEALPALPRDTAAEVEPQETGPAANWNEALYLRLYPDVAAEVRKGTFISGYHHYLAAGRTEGRQDGTPPRNWNEELYLRINPDVKNEVARGTFISGYHHYLASGKVERREGGFTPADWNEALYLRIHPDVAAEVRRGTFISGYHHYLAAGKLEHREGGFPPTGWNETRYLQVNRDVEYQIAQGLFLNGYHHYLAAGRAEKRIGGFRPDGWNEASYLSRNPVARIRLALGEYSDGYAHYAAAGQKSIHSTRGRPELEMAAPTHRRR